MVLTLHFALVAAGREPSGFPASVSHSPDGSRRSPNKAGIVNHRGTEDSEFGFMSNLCIPGVSEVSISRIQTMQRPDRKRVR